MLYYKQKYNLAVSIFFLRKIESGHIKVGQVLGEGHFGVVHRGTYLRKEQGNDVTQEVAIKTVKGMYIRCSVIIIN